MKNVPEKLVHGKKVVFTLDGSYTFYSLEYNEAYKTKSTGAFTESFHKFINASKILERIDKCDVRLLDICFGAGQNIATTLHYIGSPKNKLHIVSVEKDFSLIDIVRDYKILSPIKGYDILRLLLASSGFFSKQKEYNDSNVFIQYDDIKNISLELYIMDAVEFIDMLKGRFDVIYFDPFSKRNNPLMWSVDIFKKLNALLTNDGVLLTYGSSKEIVADMQTSGFEIEFLQSVGERKHKSVIARKINQK